MRIRSKVHAGPALSGLLKPAACGGIPSLVTDDKMQVTCGKCKQTLGRLAWEKRDSKLCETVVQFPIFKENHMTPVPVIRIEFEHMRVGLQAMLAEHKMHLDQDIQAAVDNFFKPENIIPALNDMVRQTLSSALKSEMENYFRWGPGREAFKKLIVKELDTMLGGIGDA